MGISPLGYSKKCNGARHSVITFYSLRSDMHVPRQRSSTNDVFSIHIAILIFFHFWLCGNLNLLPQILSVWLLGYCSWMHLDG